MAFAPIYTTSTIRELEARERELLAQIRILCAVITDLTHEVQEPSAVELTSGPLQTSSPDDGNDGGFGIGGFGKKKSKAIVIVNARMVDIDTGEILGVADGKGESQRESTSLLGGGGNWHGFGAGGANFGSSDFQQTIIGEAVKLAVDQMSTGLITNNGKLQTRTVNVAGLVAAVEGGQIILNVGGKAGLKVGDQLNVERVTREIKDPATGTVIRRLASAVGVVKITELDDISAVAVAVFHGVALLLMALERADPQLL